MNPDWQTFAAPLVVGLTLLIFAVRWLRNRAKGGSAGSCAGCACAPKPGPIQNRGPAMNQKS